LAQSPPTPAEIQALEQAVQQLQTDVNAYTVLEATVVSDGTAVTAAQAQLATDTALTVPAAAAVNTDVQTVIADAQALLNSVSGSKLSACKDSLPNDDLADLSEAVSRGFGSRLAVGPYRVVTLAVRSHIADLKAGTGGSSDDKFRAALTSALAPSPQRACRVATVAVLFLEMAPAFGLNIPNYAQVLAIAQQLEAQACGTPVPTPVPPIPPVPVPTPVPVPPTPVPTGKVFYQPIAIKTQK